MGVAVLLLNQPQKMKLLILISLATLGVSAAQKERDGKLFLVTSTTSTTVSTTTSLLSTTTTCFDVTAITASCGRKKRMIMSQDPITDAKEEIEVSRVNRDVAETVPEEKLSSGHNKEDTKGTRDAKFFWYYMTTTSTSTSTSSSYTATYTVTLTGCTPTVTFTACG